MNAEDAKHSELRKTHSATISDEACGMDEFVKSLSRLEVCLETPVVPGEMVSWGTAIHKAVNHLGASLRQEINVMHPAVYAQISREDAELLRRVDQLRMEDARLLDFYTQFADQLNRFRDRAERAEPNEAKLDPQVSEVVVNGLDLVISLRKQKQALKTWLLEAFHRDTGFAD